VSVTEWLSNGPTSQWIGPQTSISTAECASGEYDYRITFDLTGYDAATAVINGGWITDNAGLKILINGVDTGYTHSSTQFTTASTFTITSGFVSDVNTLDFIVNNDSGNSINPTGLRVTMSGSVSASATPEPSTLALLASALLGLAAFYLRRRWAKA
jgi:hypothetical protein